MLKQMQIENFTVFAKADFEFAPGLNVIIGENGTGKSHVLKLAYATIQQANDIVSNKSSASGKLNRVFGSVTADQLCRFRAESSTGYFQAHLKFDQNNGQIYITHKKSESDGILLGPNTSTKDYKYAKAVFFPTRELLSIYPGFVSLYEARYLEFEETYRDTCLLLGEPLLKKPMTDLMVILEEAMGGKVELDHGRFYLVTPEQGKLEMPLVAEGLRKLAMLAQLIAVGALVKGGYLFWDEPEANLNPRLTKVIAGVILQLAKAGIQIFIATHSLFLLRELEVLQAAEKKPVPQRYFALKQGLDGVEVEQGNAVDDLQTLILLEEELMQSDRYMDVGQ
ncbi:MAG: AAA family ATPase [Thiolinea sp.]